MSMVQGQIPQKSGFPCTLRAVLGSHGIVVKCTAAIFFSYGRFQWWCDNIERAEYLLHTQMQRLT